jgi:hypothetical protein
MKTVNHTKIRSNTCYQYNELAQVLGVSLTTIRNWKRAGMKVLEEGSRPLLVMGFEVIRFLAQRKQKRKVHIQKGEIFCRNCLASRKSKPDNIKIEQTGKKIGKANQIIVRGICEVCEAKMIKFSTDVKLAEQSLIIIGNDTPSETLYLEVEKRTECNINNEKVKIRFYQWVREADGLSELTITGISHAINLYEEYTRYEDLRLFNSNKAIEFKRKLRERIFRGKLISNSTYRTYLKYLKKFFAWLSMQPGYKSKIRGDYIAYFNLRKKEDRVAYQYIRPDFHCLIIV